MAFPNDVAKSVISYSKDTTIFSPENIRKNQAIVNHITFTQSQLSLSGKATCISFFLGTIKELNQVGLAGLTVSGIAKVSYFKSRTAIYKFYDNVDDVVEALANALIEGIKDGTVLESDLTKSEQFLIKYINKDK